MLLVTSAVKTLVSISQNGINPITLNEQIDNHSIRHIINASNNLGFFNCAVHHCVQCCCDTAPVGPFTELRARMPTWDTN
jgi:hypothetical protein